MVPKELLFRRREDENRLAEILANVPVCGLRVSKRALIISLWTGVTVALFFLLFRLWIRIRVFRRLQVDDPFVIFAWFAFLANAAIWTGLREEFYMTMSLSSGTIAHLPSDYLDQAERVIRGNLAACILAYTSLWSIKLSFLMFFRRFGEKLQSQRIAWYAVFAFIIAGFFVCIGTLNYRCLTSSGMDIITICTNRHWMWYQSVGLRVSTALDVVTDTAIILLMTNVLWHVRLATCTKLALAGIFSLTIFVIIVAIIRVTVVISEERLDLSWLVLWHGIEISVAFAVISLASYRTLYTAKQKEKDAHMAPQSNESDSMGTKKESGITYEWAVLSNGTIRGFDGEQFDPETRI